MSNNQVKKGWEEIVISHEKSKRIVHFLIRDTNANSFVAVVGIERSIRHMTYTVTNDFLRIFGSTSKVHAGKKWKSRKNVVKFLKSVINGGGPIFDNSILKTIPHLQVPMAMMTRFSRRNLADEQVPGSSTQHDLDIVWSGKAWTCSNQLKHYSSFVRNGTKIPVYSFVWVMSGDIKGSLGYLQDIYEDQQGKKMAIVRWFVYGNEIGWDQIRNSYPEPREVFITPLEHEISIECIDGLASILNPIHFKECDEILPQILSFQNFTCQSEYKNNEIEPFSVSRLQGYTTQPILYTLKSEVNRQSSNRGKSIEHVHVLGALCGLVISENTIGEPAEPPQSQWSPNVGEDIEILSQDSGMRGCWFRCKILRSSHNRLRVQYYDVDDIVDGQAKLEEWVPSTRVAGPDNLGMRCTGRLTVRPRPDWDSTGFRYGVGTAVDAWLGDGWWEGVVIRENPSRGSSFRVYFPGEKKILPVDRTNLRVSKDWVDNRWVNIEPKSDILVSISEAL